MADTLTKKQRSYCMSQIKSRNTAVELLFRKFLRQRGYKDYSLRSKMTGKPDLYFPKRKLAVFIDGCFWHKCPKCFIGPKSKNEYWDKKIRNNIIRDKQINSALKKQKIKVLRYWEHEVRNNINKCFTKFKKIYGKTI